jgi:hypothetical protein
MTNGRGAEYESGGEGVRFCEYRDLGRHEQKAILLVALLLVAGCHRETADQALDRALQETNKTRDATAQFAGKVTVDGQRPELEKGQSLVVILYDPQKPPPNRQTMPRTARCRPDGSFAFNTYGTDDGAPIGNYIVLFAALKPSKTGFRGPDGLKNLFNDPDKNEKIPDYHIELKAPGKTDWSFDLAVAGKEPVTNPGPHAATGIIKGH